MSPAPAAAPDRGRSALDGVEAVNAMVNLMREHVPQETRIHYVITDGGKAPPMPPGPRRPPRPPPPVSAQAR